MVDIQGGLFSHPRGEQQTLSMPGRDDADQQALISPFEVPQTFPEATSYQARDELEEMIGRDLFAFGYPAGGAR